MPNIQSAKKRVKVSKTKNLRNRMVKTGVKTSLKKFNAALAEGVEPATAQLSAPRLPTPDIGQRKNPHGLCLAGFLHFKYF